MPVTLENLSNQLVLVQCNSGTTLHLAPRKTVGEIMDVEIANNPSVQKLLDRHMIAVHHGEKASPESKKEKTESPRHKK